MEMRVEQLSLESGVPVDTIRYYQSKGLLDPPRRQGRVAWYQDDHLHRLARIRSLQQRGFTLAAIVRLVNGELDAADEALVGELSGAGRLPREEPPEGGAPTADVSRSAGVHRSADERPDRRTGTVDVAGDRTGPVDGTGRPAAEDDVFTLGELAVETGVPLALLKAVEAEGLLIPRRIGGRERYTAEDVAASRAGLLLLEWGIPLSALLDLARRHNEATRVVAEEAVALFSTHVRDRLRDHGPKSDEARPAEASDQAVQSGLPGPVEPSDIERLLRAYSELLPAVNALVGHHFTRTLVNVALDHVERAGSDEEQQAIWDQLQLDEASVRP
jgi:DNA-binding transcriptional MerR regulator